MLNYRWFIRMLVWSLFMTFFTWVTYKILLLITGTKSPLITLESNLLGFSSIFISIAFTFMLISAIVNIRLPYSKAREQILSNFAIDSAKIVFKIATETDLKEKNKLKNQQLELHKKFESIMSDGILKYDGTFDEDWRKPLVNARKRLIDEEERMLRHNKVNLEAAIFMALVGVILPAYHIFFGGEQSPITNIQTFFASYGPIFSVVVIFEVISTFFLRAYTKTEDRIERNKNEITNIELRLAAGQLLEYKTDGKNKNKFVSFADTLSKEERNFVLKKNETSAITDIDKLDIDRAVEIAIKAIKATK